jgi:hypothetical protein
MIKSTLALAAAACALHSHAGDFHSVGTLTQGEFASLARDLGAAFSYKGVTPATALGPLGFDIGLEVTDTRIDSASAFERAGAGSRSDIVIPKLHVNKGLFGGLDIGAFIGGAPQVSASLIGLDLRYTIIDDTLTTPALAIRVSGTRTGGLGDLKVTTAAFDVMASKQFTALTPYVGAGAVRTVASVGGGALSEERFNKGRAFIGLNVNLVGANLAVEAEKMGSDTSLSAKVGLRF